MLAATLWAVPALASWMIPPSPYRAKDFTVVKKDGIYHVFYIRNNPNVPADQTQLNFGHATSKDLYFWQQQDTVLQVRPGLFDQAHVWAPSIVERDGVYYLFYTGVMDTSGYSDYQQMGVATSTDLYNWNRVDVPILNCDRIPWSWCDSLQSTPFRDPFVMADPTQPGRWLMYYSSALATDTGAMVVGAAASSGDFTQWQDLEPLMITERSFTGNNVVESPNLFEHDGLWYLFFSTWATQPITFCTSPDPLATPDQWNYRGRLATMLGLNTQSWFAPEYFRDGLVEYFCFVNGDRVEMDKMVWTDSTDFALIQPDLFHVQSLTWTAPAVRAGQVATLNIASTWWSQRTADLEVLWLDDTGAPHLVDNSIVGIPDHIPLSADVTSYSWLSRMLPDSLGAPTQPSLVFRMKDQTATAAPIEVLLPKGGDPGPTPLPISGSGDGSGGDGEMQQLGPNPKLRTAQGVFASRPSLVVELPSVQPARLDVFDLQGRRVCTLADRALPKGATVLAWDGRDAAGRMAPRGLYFARLVTPIATRTARILLR